MGDLGQRTVSKIRVVSFNVAKANPRRAADIVAEILAATFDDCFICIQEAGRWQKLAGTSFGSHFLFGAMESDCLILCPMQFLPMVRAIFSDTRHFGLVLGHGEWRINVISSHLMWQTLDDAKEMEAVITMEEILTEIMDGTGVIPLKSLSFIGVDANTSPPPYAVH